VKITMQKEIEDLQTTLHNNGEKLWNGLAIPKTFVTNKDTAHAQALKDAKALEVSWATSVNSINKNTDTVEKKNLSFKASLVSLTAEYDSLQKKVLEYNRTAGSGKQIALTGGTGKISGVLGVSDTKGLQDARKEMAALNKEFADLTRTARADNVLEKRLTNLAEEARKSGVRLEELKDKATKLNQTFSNVSSKTYTNDASKAGVVTATQNTLNSLLNQSGTLTPAKAEEIAAAIRKVDLAMREFTQTGSRVKDSTGSPFDNLFKGIPRLQVTVDVMKAKVADSLTTIDAQGRKVTRTLASLDDAEFGKIEKQFKRFGYTINQVTGEVTKLKKVSDQSKGMFSWLPESLGGMAARLTEFYSLRTIIFAVSSQFRDATRSAIELNQAVYDILAISGDSRAKFDKINDAIYNIAKNSRFTAQEVAGLMQVLAQAGVTAEALPTVSSQVGIFATATASDPKMAADLVTTAMNVYSIKAEQVARITNAMTAALNLSKLEASGLSTAFNYLAPQAAQLGISMEQTLGIVANMAQSGIKASTIGTGVSQLLKEFAAPKERLRNMLSSHGLSAADINPMTKDFADIVQTLQDKGIKVDELFQAMETRVGRAAVTAINLSAESFRNMTASLTGTQAALIAYDKTMDGAKARMNQIKQTTAEIASAVGDHLAPSFIQGTQALRGWVTALGGANGSIATVIVGLTTLGGGMLALYKIAGLIQVGVATLTASLTATAAAAGTTSVAVGVLNGVMKTLKLGMFVGPQAGIMLVLAGIAAAVYAVGKAFDYKKEKQEEANKKELESIAQGERLDRTLNGVAHANKKVSDAYTKYYEAIKAGKTEAEALASLETVQLEIKDEQRKALLLYVAEGGPHAKYIDSLFKEKGALEALIKLESLRREEKNVTAVNAAKEYTMAWEAGQAGMNERATNRYMKKLRGSGAGQFRELTTREKDNLWSSSLSEEQALLRKDNAKKAEAAVGATQLDVPTGRATSEFHIGADGRPTWVHIPEPKQMTPSDKLGGGGAGKFVPKDSTNDNLINILRARREAMTNEAKLSEMTQDDITKMFVEDNKLLIEKITDSFTTTGSKEALAKMLGQLDTLQKVDEAIAKFTGDRAVDKAKTSGLKGLKLQTNLVTAEAMDTVTENKLKTEREVAKKKALDIVEKKEKDFIDGFAKLKDETAKKVAELQKKNWEHIMQDGYASDEDRGKAYGSYIEAERTRLIADANLKAAPLLNKLPKDSPKRKEVEAERDAYVAQGMTEALTGAGDKKHTGELASIDLKIKTEQQLLQTKQAALAAQEKEAWTAQEIARVKTKGLEAERDSIDITTRLMEEKWLIAKTAEEEARWEAEILALEENRAKVNRDIAETNQSSLSAFSDGVKASWQQLTDTRKLTKELGSSLANLTFNGVASSLSSAMSTIFSPDTEKINEITQKIVDLRAQKTTLESEIATIEANTSQTPEELKNLQDKKVALDSVNNSLKEQEAAVRKQKDAWAAFSEGIKGIMKTIIKELQAYIAKLFVVWAVQKMIGLFSGGGEEGTYSDDSGIIYEQNGGVVPVQKFANGNVVKTLKDLGGYIPMSMGTQGQDSVPAMLMPGEVVIKKSTVDFYGQDFLLALNDKKIEKLAAGGAVGGRSTSTGSGEGTGYSLQIVNVADPTSIPQPPVDAQQVINIVSFNIASKGTLEKVIKGSLGSGR